MPPKTPLSSDLSKHLALDGPVCIQNVSQSRSADIGSVLPFTVDHNEYYYMDREHLIQDQHCPGLADVAGSASAGVLLPQQDSSLCHHDNSIQSDLSPI